MSKSSRSSLSICVLLLLLLRATELRWLRLTRAIWEDEIHHNQVILAAKNLKKLLGGITFQFQPHLDYLLRKVFWFPLTGYQELGLRLPALFYSLMSVAFCYLTTYFLVRRRSSSVYREYFAMAFGFCAGLWAVYQPTDMIYAGEARHYTFVGLLSLAWFYTYFISDRSWALKNAVSLLFVNSHFFALPLVLGAHALEWLTQVRSRQTQAAWRRFLWTSAIVIVTIAANYSALRQLLLQSPDAVGVSFFMSLKGGLRDGVKVWLDSLEFLALPYTAFLFVADLFFAAIKKGDARLWRLVWLSLVILPLFYVSSKMRSTYGFGDRYFFPNLGLGLVLLQLGFVSAIEALGKLPRQRWMAVGVVGITVFFTISFSNLTDFAVRVFADARAMSLPAENFSPWFKIYEELKAEDRPLFVLYAHCWNSDVAEYYLENSGTRFHSGHFAHASFSGCETVIPAVPALMADFLKNYPQGLVVLDDKDHDCLLAPDSLGVGEAHMQRIRILGKCVWKISGARSVSQVGFLADQVKFPHAAGVFGL